MKWLKLLLKVMVGLVVFYLLLGFVILPLILTWVIPSQASKLLKTPVHLHALTMNPVCPKVTMSGFEILGQDQRPLIAFDQLSVRVSFLGLLKKMIHVQSFELDGLKVNAVLLQGNKINLMALVPPENNAPKGAVGKATSPLKSEGQAALVLPTVIIDKIALHQAQVHFTDTTITPAFASTLGPIELSITHLTTNPQTQAKIKFNSSLDEKGKITMETVIIPMAQPLDMETTLSLNDYALKILTPYIGKYTGHALKSGDMDLTVNYRISGNKLVANHQLMIQSFAFGNSMESKNALHLPFGLAVALLEDPDGRMRINLPVTGNTNDPKFQYSHLLLQVARNFFLNLVTKPFSFLASGLGMSPGMSVDELGYVRFKPGQTDLSASQRSKLITLIKGLKEHPKLKLEIDGSYDPDTDWRSIQADSFAKDYAALRKISSRPDSAVYQMLYQRRFGIRALWTLAKKYKHGFGNYNDPKLDAEIKRQLIENAPPDTAALSILANARAKTVQDFFIKSGFDPKRLTVGHPQSTPSSMGYVPLPFTLTVLDEK